MDTNEKNPGSLIENSKQLKNNIKTFESYLVEENEGIRNKAKGYIKRGACFVVYTVGNELRFIPSKFIGYINNSLTEHEEKRRIRDGKKTNKAINAVLGDKIVDGEVKHGNLDRQLDKYYKKLMNVKPDDTSVKPDSKPHSFWLLDQSIETTFLNTDFQKADLIEEDCQFPEGSLIEKKHKLRERSSKLTELAKQMFKKKHGTLYCEVCHFNFEEHYGKIGKDFIEAHHTIPISEMEEGHKTKVEEIALLCSNCHNMVHRKRPWLQMNKLKQLMINDPS